MAVKEKSRVDYVAFTTEMYRLAEELKVSHACSDLEYLQAMLVVFSATEIKLGMFLGSQVLRNLLHQWLNYKRRINLNAAISPQDYALINRALIATAAKANSPSVNQLRFGSVPAPSKRKTKEANFVELIPKLKDYEIGGYPIWFFVVLLYDVASNLFGVTLVFSPYQSLASNVFVLLSLPLACLIIAMSQRLFLWGAKNLYKTIRSQPKEGDRPFKLIAITVYTACFFGFFALWVFDFYTSALLFAAPMGYTLIGWIMGGVVSLLIEVLETHQEARRKFGYKFYK